MLATVDLHRRWKPLGWGNVRPRPWGDIAALFRDLASTYPDFQPMVDIVDSVICAGVDDRIGATTSMQDLVVFNLALAGPPHDAVCVWFLPGRWPVRSDSIRIRHASFTGHDDEIECPAADAVPLFWLFMHYKFAVVPHQHGAGQPESAVVAHDHEDLWT